MAAIITVLGACSAGSRGNSSNGSAAPVTVGLVTTLTGPAAANFNGNLQGAQARIDLQNSRGGVDGHRLQLIGVDDQTSLQGAASAMSELIGAKHVFGIIDLSDFTVSASRLAQQAGVPVVGFPTDGPEWGQKPNTNMISVIGNVPPTGIGGVVNTLYPDVATLLGARNMAALAIDAEPASIEAAQSFVRASQSAGLEVGYQNFSIPIGSTKVDPIVLGMKQAGVDGFDSGLLDNTNYALLAAARQAGLHLVAPILVSGYGQEVLDQPATEQAAQGAVFQLFQRPVSQPDAGTRTEQSAFSTYEHFTGIPSIGWTEGWISADLFIQGLSKSGAEPTRKSFLDALHNLKGYDAEGLLANPIDLSLAGFGTPPTRECYWFAQLEGSRFVLLGAGKPICGRNVP